MFHIRVERVLKKNIDAVFEAIADHASYARFPGVKKAELLEEGHSERNGEGAFRHIHGGPVHFYERITAFERPGRMAYHIEESKPVSIRHDRGEIVLTSVGDGTRVVWESEGHIEVPLVGSVLDKLAELRLSAAFGALLRAIELE